MCEERILCEALFPPPVFELETVCFIYSSFETSGRASIVQRKHVEKYKSDEFEEGESKPKMLRNQKFELCQYARDNKEALEAYVQWIKARWNVISQPF